MIEITNTLDIQSGFIANSFYKELINFLSNSNKAIASKTDTLYNIRIIF